VKRDRQVDGGKKEKRKNRSLKSDTCMDFRIRDGMSLLRKENLGAEVGC